MQGEEIFFFNSLELQTINRFFFFLDVSVHDQHLCKNWDNAEAKPEGKLPLRPSRIWLSQCVPITPGLIPNSGSGSVIWRSRPIPPGF